MSTGVSRKRRSDTVIVTKETAAATASVTMQKASLPNNRHATVRLKRFHAVAAWSWNANDDVCGICQTAFEGTAPGVKYPGEDCPVVWGKCGHAYHLQCVSQWLTTASSKNSCPICRQEWEFGQNPVNTNSANNASETRTAGNDPAVEASATRETAEVRNQEAVPL